MLLPDNGGVLVAGGTLNGVAQAGVDNKDQPERSRVTHHVLLSTPAWATPFEVPPATRTPPLSGRSTAE